MGTRSGPHMGTDKDGESVMQITAKLGLKKPESNEYINVADFNYNADQIDKLGAVKTATLPSAGWSNTAPYTQTVEVPGVQAIDTPVVSLYLSDGVTAAEVKLQSKAYGYADRAVTGAGSITVYCYNKKPAVDFQIQLKGV